MNQTLDLRLSPEVANDPDAIVAGIAGKTGLPVEEVRYYQIERRSIDARGRRVVVQLRIRVSDQPLPTPSDLKSQLQPVFDAPEVLIVGAGPAGYFAALELIELGLRPVIFERGQDVRSRRKALRAIQQFGIVNPHSNYCFGEGGAGTYSDGKLYTRSHKRGNIAKILRWLVEHGAHPDILVDAHPHIGSNQLPRMVSRLRETIESFGGTVHFGAHVTDLAIDAGQLRGIHWGEGQFHAGHALILASGHSARDVFEMLCRHALALEFKPFALGVRIEHPQALIDEIQYKQSPRSPYLPASSYALSCQLGDKGVFSFCMCPGGLVVPAATSPGEIVVNGMSLSRRDSAYANAGTVVSIDEQDLDAPVAGNPFAGVDFQARVERSMFDAGDGSQKAPAQRLVDFMAGKLSPDLPESSYIPGLYAAPLHQLLPGFVYQSLRRAIPQFEQKMRGYTTREAVVIGTESRTSSPIRIPRHAESLMHPDLTGLFPCGEGAGYAGGIVSAAMDGQRVARAVARHLHQP
ncbi:NAD(P)/FAD-dependent oxidoreductase [Candidatus Entotheonella palauensis]|uniref:NAD(P)/FAD-dependent oxidoreductase n=1 Tax=Candidatus Entotheonella palauensis TaxID=93172 RepID=UPI000B7F8A38|nr:FAD-binding protein [Candidatus Entotheonella palauensis]